MARCWKCHKRCRADLSCLWCRRGPMCLGCKCDCKLWPSDEPATSVDAVREDVEVTTESATRVKASS